MIVLIWVLLLISTVIVGVHAAILAVSPEPRPDQDLDPRRPSSGSEIATEVLIEWEKQDGNR